MAGALTEFGRKSTGYKVGVFVAIAAVLALLYWKAPLPFGFKKAKVRLDDAQAENTTLIKQSEKLDNDAKEYKQKLAEFDQLKKIIEENQKALPTEAELPAFFDTLGRKVGEAQVEVKRWDYLKEVPIDSYIKVPIEIELTGTFYQLKRFFASLVQRDPVPTLNPDGTTQVEDRERIITVENLQIYDPRVKNGELVMTSKFVASTFRQEAPPEPDKDKEPKDGKKPGAKPDAAGSAAGSAAPLPPEATPDGAKVRTENAIQQGQDRLDKGLGSAAPTAGSDKLKGGVP